MSTHVENTIGSDFHVRLAAGERDHLGALARELVGAPPARIDDRDWIRAARELSCAAPLTLRGALRRFARDSGPDGMLLLANLPVDDDPLPDTPSVKGSVQRTPTVPAAALALTGMALGEVVAFDKEKSGALVQDVVPVAGMERFQGNAGSVKLNMHVENAFHEFRPDLVGLMCLRNDHDNVAALRVACIRRALPLLSDATRAVLHEPRYVTAAPASFALPPGMDMPHGVLRGPVEDPDVKVDFSSTEPVDDAAGAALVELEAAIDAVAHTLILGPGDLAFVDNRVALHGRNSFQPRYDGRDRWLQRIFVHLDVRRSRALRAGDGQVLASAART